MQKDTLASLPSDDRHWVKPNGDNFNNERWYKRSKEKDAKKDEKEEEIEDITSYHVFGLDWSSDVKYNMKMIKVMNKAINNNQEDLYELVNRTDTAFDQIQSFAESVMEMRFLGLKSSVEKTFMEVRQAQKAAVLYQVLEEKMGRVIYLQDLMTHTQAFRKGVHYILRASWQWIWFRRRP